MSLVSNYTSGIGIRKKKFNAKKIIILLKYENHSSLTWDKPFISPIFTSESKVEENSHKTLKFQFPKKSNSMYCHNIRKISLNIYKKSYRFQDFGFSSTKISSEEYFKRNSIK